VIGHKRIALALMRSAMVQRALLLMVVLMALRYMLG
jgi:hypothetical protein